MVGPNNLAYAFSWVKHKVLVTKIYSDQKSSSHLEVFSFNPIHHGRGGATEVYPQKTRL